MAPKSSAGTPASGATWQSLLRRHEVGVLAAGLLIAVLLLWVFRTQLEALLVRSEEARHWIADFGSLAPLVYILIFASQIVFAPLPGHFMAMMGGYLFGFGWGLFYSLLGVLIGAGVAMSISRLFGRPLVERFFAPEQVRLWERKLRTRSFATWWLLFLFPIPDLIYYAAGLTSTPLRTLLLAVLTGRGLGLLFATVIGNWTAVLPPDWVLIKWGVLAAAAVLVYLYQRRLRLGVLLTYRRVRRWLHRPRALFFFPRARSES